MPAEEGEIQLPEKYKQNFDVSSEGPFVGKLVALLYRTKAKTVVVFGLAYVNTVYNMYKNCLYQCRVVPM
jgi:hypothetical protein